MPRYYFHAADGQVFRDAEGRELPDLHTAKTEAVRVLSEILRDDPGLFLKGELLEIRVADAEAEIKYRLVVAAIFGGRDLSKPEG